MPSLVKCVGVKFGTRKPAVSARALRMKIVLNVDSEKKQR